MCKGAGDRASSSRVGGAGSKEQPEAAKFDTYESFACEIFIGQAHLEGMVVEVGLAGSTNQPDGTWLGGTGSSHHIKSTKTGMVNLEPCPPRTESARCKDSLMCKSGEQYSLRWMERTVNISCSCVRLRYRPRY